MFTVRRTDDGRAMLDAVRASLLAREIENSIVLAVLARVATGKERADLLAWVEDDEGKVRASALRTARPQALVSTGPREAIEALADAIATSHPSLGGLHAMGDVADAFTARWCAKTNDRSRIGLQTTVYAATSVTSPRDPGGAPRLASSSEIDRIVPWLEDFSREAEVPTDGSPIEMARKHIGGESLWLWDHDAPKCMAIVSEATASTSRIAWVFTPKDARKRGYGSALVASLTAGAIARGKRAVTLNADVRNATSNGIYTRIGYVPLGLSKTVLFEHG
jgi:predicted GNAT family acetyltransferase